MFLLAGNLPIELEINERAATLIASAFLSSTTYADACNEKFVTVIVNGVRHLVRLHLPSSIAQLGFFPVIRMPVVWPVVVLLYVDVNKVSLWCWCSLRYSCRVLFLSPRTVCKQCCTIFNQMSLGYITGYMPGIKVES